MAKDGNAPQGAVAVSLHPLDSGDGPGREEAQQAGPVVGLSVGEPELDLALAP